MTANTGLTGILTLIVVIGCSLNPSASVLQPKPSPIIAWLDCVECTDGELQAVVALGDRAVAELRSVLLGGPPKDRLDQEQLHLEKTYLALKEYEREHPERKVPVSQTEYVQLYQQKFILLNRIRAARALGGIGSAGAKSALNEALRTSLPPDLRQAVEAALRRHK